MNFRQAINILKKQLKEKQPLTFSSSWIYRNTPASYRYFRLNYRTENDQIDWDKVTYQLPRSFQKRWIRYRHKTAKGYENREEIDLVLNKHRLKLYTIITPITEVDKKRRERIIIALVRVAQKGNTLAGQELSHWLSYIIDDWVDRYYTLRVWRGYTDIIQIKIDGCIRGYRYTGSFLGYLYRTLEYAGRGLCPLQKFSFDDPILDGQKTRIDYFIHDP
ncbi:MAG: hypothetical protein WCW56_03000 [Candidatus Paceibacterota bacterium]|jgi:hypothetical protein